MAGTIATGSHSREGAARRLAERLAIATSLSPWAIVMAAGVTLALLMLAGAYGWHRDELYYVVAGRHPAFGYPDQPPLTPILSALAVGILGPSPVSVRILPAIVTGLILLLTADMARRFGGGRKAQVVAVASLAASGFLFSGHLSSTSTYDVAIWTLISWLVVRLLAGGDPRLWLAVGLAGGVGFENKHLVVFLAIGLVAGLVLARRWDVLRSPFAWAGAVTAVVVALPNVLWQAAHGWPALDMAEAIARGAADRSTFVLELWLLAGSFVVFVPLLGLAWLLLRREARPWRALGWAPLVVLALVVVTDGKSYYAVGLLAPLGAAGATFVERWLDRRWPRVRQAAVGALAAASIGVMALVTLPIVPASMLADTPIPDINKEQAAQIGWPELVATVRAAVDSMPEADRASAVILTSNYGEAAAIELLAPDLPPVYSGHNGYWDWGPPPDGRTAAILVGSRDFFAPGVAGCTVAGTIRNDAHVLNQEVGNQVRICLTVPPSFAESWRYVRHLD